MASLNERILAEIVRVGKVADINDKGQARVIFEDRCELVSDYLPVVSSSTSPYKPKVNDKVLCIYQPILDRGVSDGFIIGALGGGD